jgi:hypothetical protein
MPTPNNFEQEVLELLNRVRMNPGGEFDALIANAATRTAVAENISDALSYFGVDKAAMRSQFAAFPAVAPLAWNAALSLAATRHTEAMIADWRARGWDRVLTEAARRGVMLAGVSAGAVCWFDKFLYSSGTGPMRPLDGLGLIRGGACPHYSTEADRQAALNAAVSNGTMPDSFAIDDGVAVLFGRDGPTAHCIAEVGAMAYQVRRRPDGVVVTTPLGVSDG